MSIEWVATRSRRIDRDQTAFSYRAGVVYAPRFDQQIYFATSSSFTPVNTVPPDGSQLDPSTARNYEVGHRWQGWNGRVDTSLAVYHITRNNVTVQESVTTFRQVGEQTASGLDVDINTDLGGRTYLIFNYGFSTPTLRRCRGTERPAPAIRSDATC